MPSPNQSLVERVSLLAQSLQFPWFVGHVLTLLGSFFYILSFFSNAKAYKIAYLGALVSYGVVIYKTHGFPKFNAAYAQRLVTDENVQYFFLAAYNFFSDPVEVTLIPFGKCWIGLAKETEERTLYRVHNNAISLTDFLFYCVVTFSVFHTLGYVRTNIIPTVFPSPPPPRQSSGSSSTSAPVTWQAKTQQTIKTWTDKNYSIAMKFVAKTEVTIIMPRLILGLLRLRIVPVVLFAQFLRFRYHLSTYTRQAFTDLRVTMDRALLPPTASAHIPPVVGRLYTTAKDMIFNFGESVVQRQPAPGQQQ
ncbi:hypothetical protein [Absidia glauca]|uniref:Uncharacterized protein n=1 Tax=Absidia glauca TaxID=4829 RepID=A0A163JVC7_ABSGL|nr:hypothetical protein [Absidia glauca]